MKRILISLVLCVLVGMVNAGQARVLNPKVELVAIKAHKTREKRGDEVYLAVTAYPSQQRPHHKQIPDNPLHWISSHLDKIKHVPVWGNGLAEGDSVTVIVSLMERDAPPWNTDDLIGTVKVHLKNANGRLQVSWSMPNSTESSATVKTRSGRTEKFELTGERSLYDLTFQVK